MVFEDGEQAAGCLTVPVSPQSSCWLSLEGGLLYAFVGPAAVIVLVRAPSVSWEGVAPGDLPPSCTLSFHLGVPLPGGHMLMPTALCPQVNMLIGIIVFNKLMARDGISDKSKKQRAG